MHVVQYSDFNCACLHIFYPSRPSQLCPTLLHWQTKAFKSFLHVCLVSVRACVYLCVSRSQHVVPISSVDAGANTWQRGKKRPHRRRYGSAVKWRSSMLY